jgi:hypothetical protein
MKTHLYLVQSPLQAINAFEARTAPGVDEAERHLAVHFETVGPYNNRLVANTLEHFGWDDVLTVPFGENPVGKLVGWLNLRWKLQGLGRIGRVHIGAYDSGVMVAAANACRSAEVWILDDGTASLLFPGYRYEGLRQRHQSSGVRRSWMGFDSRLPAKVGVFSIYDLPLRPPDTLHRNPMAVLRESIAFDDSGPVFLVGSMIPEHDICSFEDYGVWLARIREHFGDRRIHYFAHRRESMEPKIGVLEKLGIKVETPELPFELALSKASRKPSALASFYTTIFDTLVAADAVPAGRLFSFHIPPELIPDPTERAMAAKCYDAYVRGGVVSVVTDWISGQSSSTLDVVHPRRRPEN